jgi:hypothetical protein
MKPSPAAILFSCFEFKKKQETLKKSYLSIKCFQQAWPEHPQEKVAKTTIKGENP